MTLWRQSTHTSAWRRMLTPIRYLLIKQPAKWAFDFGWPIALAVLTIGAFLLLPVRPAILGEKGFLRGLHDLIGLLAAFFVAALAAVSTVERKALDAPMLGMPPTLDGEALSRRRFVCMLFGYLSFLSFALYLGSIIAEVVAPSLRASVSSVTLDAIRFLLGAIYAVAFWSMACTTLLGIWFLVERVPMTLVPEADPDFVASLEMPPPAWLPKAENAETEQRTRDT